MRRILLTLAILIFTTQTAFAVNYPHTGYCTGNYVRLRDNPGTEDTEVLEGRVFEGNLLVVLDEVFVDGEKWYEIDYPFGEGTAWIFGKYVEIYEREFEETPKHIVPVFMQLFQDYGTIPEKAKVIFGKPKRDKKTKSYYEPAGRDLEFEDLEYPNLTLNYVEGRLRGIEITGRGSNLNFGKIRVGDSVEKLQEEFGEPHDKYDEVGEWDYEFAEGRLFEFFIRNGKIYKMSYGERMD
ncbi:MAG: hypothetical protein IJP69_04875 [Synergistaceae bacterium]|nr:hypothetical protein [Synergistaceae bacterium]